jgi:hypothetical protein
MLNTKGSVKSLIESASRRGNIPDSQMTYLTADFIAMAQEELMAFALPVLHARRDDYYLEELTFDLSKPDTIIGGSQFSAVRHLGFRLPEYAMASTVRDVQAVSSSGNWYNLGRVEVDDVPNMMSQAWYFYGNYIVFQLNSVSSVAPPTAIRCIVHVKPNQLVPEDVPFSDVTTETGLGINHSARIVTMTTTSAMQLDRAVVTQTGSLVDFVSGTPGYEVKDRSLLCVPTTTTFLTLLQEPPTPLVAGDWVTAVGYTPMVPLPLEMHALLAQRIVVKFLEAQGEEAQLTQARDSLDEMVRQIPLLLQPRAEGKPKKLAPRLGLWRRWRW